MFVYISPAPASVLGEGGNGQVVGEGDIPYPECLLQHYTVILSPDWGCVFVSCLSDVRMLFIVLVNHQSTSEGSFHFIKWIESILI